MNKLQKFAELLSFPHVYENFSVKEDFLVGQHGVELQMKGKWKSDHFKNDKPITLELACGRGEYSVALGRMHPDRNFIGLDIKLFPDPKLVTSPPVGSFVILFPKSTML